MSQGKYLITALISYILDELQYKVGLFKYDIFSNLIYISEQVVQNWLVPIITDYINPIRDLNKQKEAETTFLKKIDTLEEIKKCIQRNRAKKTNTFENDFKLNLELPRFRPDNASQQ